MSTPTSNRILEVRKNVIEKFTELKSALIMREKLLLRQLDVINKTKEQQKQQQQQQLIANNSERKGTYSSKQYNNADDIEFLCDNEIELFESIRNFGRYQIAANISKTILQDMMHMKNEDYIMPKNDHEIFYKDLATAITTTQIDADEAPETVMVDFSQQKLLMEDNARKMNESVINITLSEAKELIRKAKQRKECAVPPLNLEELDDNMESSLADVVSSLTVSDNIQETERDSNSCKSKYSQMHSSIFGNGLKCCKHKITINNCNGTINLKNIAALTINCTTDDKLQTELPVVNTDDNSKTSVFEKKEGSSKKLFSTDSTVSSSSIFSESNNTNNDVSEKAIYRNSSSNDSVIATVNGKTNSVKKRRSQQSSTILNGSAIKHNNKVLNDPNEISETLSSDGTTCDFYNRLLNEIKKTIKQNQHKCHTYERNGQQKQQQEGGSDTIKDLNDAIKLNENMNGNYERPKHFVLKNYENLRIILEARNSEDETFHPIQIEQWLADIIADTDLEPMQNTDILEHSKIYHQQQQQLHEEQKSSTALKDLIAETK